MGYSLGEIISLSLLFEFTKDLNPRYSWGILAGLMVFSALLCLYMIDEPPEGIKQEPFCNKFITLTKKQYEAMRDNKSLLTGMLLVIFVFGPMILFEIFLMEWLRSFNSSDGPINNVSQVYWLY
jgi:cobalamin biosynthesis protein CobD/CbiB